MSILSSLTPACLKLLKITNTGIDVVCPKVEESPAEEDCPVEEEAAAKWEGPTEEEDPAAREGPAAGDDERSCPKVLELGAGIMAEVLFGR